MLQKNTKLTNQGYVIQKNELSETRLIAIKKELTVKPENKFAKKPNPKYPKKAPPKNNQENNKKDPKLEDTEFTVFKEDDTTITVPRFYGIEQFGEPAENAISKGKKSSFKFKGELKDFQKIIVDKVISVWKEKGGGLISLPCGRGKTVVSLYLASLMKLKTLVIVHKSFLIGQWEERIKQFTNAKIGLIRQDKIDIAGKDIVIGMLGSICKRDYDLKLFAGFGTLLIDESHHISSNKFSQALPKIGAKYVLGLSATPVRKDGLSKVFTWHIGEILYKELQAKNCAVIVKFLWFTSKDENFKEFRMRWTADPNIPKMITNLIEIGKRNNFTKKVILQVATGNKYTQVTETVQRKAKGRSRKMIDVELKYNKYEVDNRKILILSERIGHLETIKDLIDTDIKAKKLNHVTAFYVGGMKKDELQTAEKADIIFGSFQMAQEGLDIKGLNAIVMITSRRDIIQAIGRILGERAKYYTIRPLIVDICDDLSCFTNQGTFRINYYISQGYHVDQYRSEDGKLKDSTLEETMKIPGLEEKLPEDDLDLDQLMDNITMNKEESLFADSDVENNEPTNDKIKTDKDDAFVDSDAEDNCKIKSDKTDTESEADDEKSDNDSEDDCDKEIQKTEKFLKNFEEIHESQTANKIIPDDAENIDNIEPIINTNDIMFIDSDSEDNLMSSKKREPTKDIMSQEINRIFVDNDKYYIDIDEDMFIDTDASDSDTKIIKI